MKTAIDLIERIDRVVEFFVVNKKLERANRFLIEYEHANEFEQPYILEQYELEQTGGHCCQNECR